MMSHDYENEQRLKDVVTGLKAHVVECFGVTGDFADALKALGRTEAVRILTIHKCKGLEFHSVIVQGVESQTFFGTQDANQCGYFVAISRAKERLVVTTSAYREKPQGANQHWRESRTPHNQFLSYVLPEIGGGG